MNGTGLDPVEVAAQLEELRLERDEARCWAVVWRWAWRNQVEATDETQEVLPWEE